MASYEQLVEYLIAKDPGSIRVATLALEGRNTVVFRTCGSDCG